MNPAEAAPSNNPAGKVKRGWGSDSSEFGESRDKADSEVLYPHEMVPSLSRPYRLGGFMLTESGVSEASRTSVVMHSSTVNGCGLRRFICRDIRRFGLQW